MDLLHEKLKMKTPKNFAKYLELKIGSKNRFVTYFSVQETKKRSPLLKVCFCEGCEITNG